MKALTFEEHGPPEVLQVVDIETPRPGPGQVRIRVRAAGVQPFDVGVRRGSLAFPVTFPQRLGNEFSGVVDQVGEGVSDWSPGDEVLGWAFMASLAEYAVAGADEVVRKPADMPWEVAGALSSSGQTAYTALRELDVGVGDTLLIHAAAGGAGTVAVQLARAWGAQLEELVELYEKGELHIEIRATFPLDAIVDAHRLVETGHGRGKVVVTFDHGPGARTGAAPRADRVAHVAAAVAAVLGSASAAMSAYWASGGDGLLDTVGGDIERWARERDTTFLVVLWFIVGLKLVVAAAAPILLNRADTHWLPAWMTGRIPRALGWIAAVTLTVYGGILTIGGLLVETGLVEASASTDETAVAWHAYLWDPWFAIWGIAFAVVLWRTRPSEPAR